MRDDFKQIREYVEAGLSKLISDSPAETLEEYPLAQVSGWRKPIPIERLEFNNEACECGRPSQIKGKCRRCYDREWRSRNLEKLARLQREYRARHR